ncbi:MAG: hypothetical protein GY749_25090 [Desulfobacteraceae bacterium]|nr:hypothetical protein [Desulfobacteraceae bacterium]
MEIYLVLLIIFLLVIITCIFLFFFFKEIKEMKIKASPQLKTELPPQDWGNAPDIPAFWGRLKELAILSQWIVKERRRLVAIVGMGGIGKTSLSVRLGKGGIGKTDLSLKLAQGIQDDFEYVIWRRLLNAPPFTEIITDFIKFLSDQQETVSTNADDQQILELLNYLKKYRCLLILDNVEAVLRDSGQYTEGYEGYGELFKKVGEVSHKSCMILTSREKPKEIAEAERETKHVCSMELSGLNVSDGRKLVEEIGSFSASDQEWRELIDFYDGNPLALELAGRHIQSVFACNISAFLKEGKPVFSDLRNLLDWHYKRLSDSEREIMYWLAINREKVSLSELRKDVLSPVAKEQLPLTMQSLQQQLPIERNEAGFTLQPVLIEYMTEQLIERTYEEIRTKKVELLNTHALLKALAKDYVREAQSRLILKPINDWLIVNFEDQTEVDNNLKYILSTLKREPPQKPVPGYAGGNVLNLLCQLNANALKGEYYDFSKLTIWQAYLQGVDLHNVNFAYSEIDHSVFTQNFGSVLSVAFSMNGKLLATGFANGEIRLWQFADAKPVLTLKQHTDSVWSVAFSPDDKFLASGSADHTVKIWRVGERECLSNLRGHKNWIRSVAFSPDGQKLASGSEDNTVKIWNVSNGKCINSLDEHTERVMSVAFSPDGQKLASGSDDNTVKIWNVSNGKCINSLNEHTERVMSVAFSTDGQKLASGSEDKAIKIWDVCTGQCLKTLEGHKDWARSVVFNPDGQTLASGGEDNTLKIWDMRDGNCLKTLEGYSKRIQSLAFSPDGQILASGNDKTVRLWDTGDYNCLKILKGYTNWALSVAFSPDGKILASGSEDCAVRLWDVINGKCKTLQEHTGSVRSVAFSPDGKTLASGSEDRLVKIWDVHTGRCLKTLRGHTNWVQSVAFSPDAKIIASSSDDKKVRIWDVRTGQCQKELKHGDWVLSVAFSSDGKMLASGSDDKTVKIWDVSKWSCIKILKGHDSRIWSLAFSPDNQKLASAGEEDNKVKIWDISKEDYYFELEHEKVWSVAFSPDGERIACAGEDSTVKIWNISNGKCLKILSGHDNRIRSVTFNPDGQTLASGSEDEMIKIWDIEKGECLKKLSPPKPYEGINITGVTGLSEEEKATLTALGAVEKISQEDYT